MDRDQIEILERAQSARLAAEARGYDATAKALCEIIEMLAHTSSCAVPVRVPRQSGFGAPSRTAPRKPFQVVS